MKLPNGYGSVYKLPGNRRKPWAVRKTIAITQHENGRTTYQYKYIGYYETKADALTALVKYNENPYDLDADKITFSEVFDQWSKEHYPKISTTNISGYNAAYKSFEALYQIPFRDIRKVHLQAVIDACGKNYPTLKKLKVLLNALYKFALENDICQKDYSHFVDILQYKDRNPNSITRVPFTAAEIDTLWANVHNDDYISTILMLIYTGVRVGELLDLRKEDVNLSEKYFDVVASKTQAGVRRVPIAEKVYPFFEHWMNKNGCNFLLSTPNREPYSYHNYYDTYWIPLLSKLLPGSVHRPHDTRHTCVSLLVAAKVDDKIIKKIIGHKGQGVTETVYTHYDIEPLLEAINKI